MPASRGKRSEKTGGGKSVVTQWVEKFDAPPLNEMFRGIIDLDDGNSAGPRIHVLSRYSVENYRLDSFVVFGVLLEEKKAPSLPGVTVTPGDEHLIRALPDSALQAVTDYVAQQVEPELGTVSSAERDPVAVAFTNGVKVTYPRWMLARRGHDLLPIYQKVFGSSVMTPPRLEKSFRRVRLVPIELAEIMSQLQQA